ncbi:MAG: hypothetical protein E6Q88_09910 [Lysobacteraceae bacterium]|nr:MAG: hypothetical protein E6Q88_09910 [Xanthomonadaceae bacterium]
MEDSAFDKKNAVLRCGESAVNQGTQDIAPAAVRNGRHLQYAIADNNGKLTVLTTDATAYAESGQFSSLNDWAATHVASLFPATLSAAFSVQGAISAVAYGAYTYVFWRDTSGRYWALRCSPDMRGKAAISSIVFDPVVYPDSRFVSSLAAFKLPSCTPAMANRIGMLVILVDGRGNRKMLPVMLDPDAFVENGDWPCDDATGGYWIDLTPLNLDDGYNQLAAGWINQGTLLLEGDSEPRLYMSLVVVCHGSGKAAASAKTFGLSLPEAFDVNYRIKHVGRTNVPTICSVSGLDNTSMTGGVTISTAPDGSLLLKWADTPDRHVRTSLFQPNTRGSDDADAGKPGLYSPRWATYSSDPDHAGPAMQAVTTPCSVFIPLPQTQGPTPSAVRPPDSDDARIYENCILQKHVECVFGTNTSGNPLLSTFYWGQIFSIPDYYRLTLVEDYKNCLMLSLLADTFPYPVPEKAVWGPDSPSGMINWLLCTYEYLVGDDTAVTVQSTTSGSTGTQFSASMLVAGLGAQTEDATTDGYTSILSKSDVVHTATSYSVTSKGLPLEISTGDAPTDDGQLKISAEGALFGVTPAPEIGIDRCTVQLRGASSAEPAIVWKMHPILTSPPAAIAGEFKTYCYTPGNPVTYSETAINERMNLLFNGRPGTEYRGLTEDQKRDFIINGEDFRSFYDGDYVSKVIERFGVGGFGPGGNADYIEVSFAEPSIMRGEFPSPSTFTHGGSAFVNGSFYAGAVVHEEGDMEGGILGIIEIEGIAFETSVTAMMGYEMSNSLDRTESSTDTWGIKLGEYLNPLAPGEAYTVRMYFLKPSPLWAAELKYFGFPEEDYPQRPDIDLRNSAPVRILFTVPYVSQPLAERLTR